MLAQTYLGQDCMHVQSIFSPTKLWSEHSLPLIYRFKFVIFLRFGKANSILLLSVFHLVWFVNKLYIYLARISCWLFFDAHEIVFRALIFPLKVCLFVFFYVQHYVILYFVKKKKVKSKAATKFITIFTTAEIAGSDWCTLKARSVFPFETDVSQLCLYHYCLKKKKRFLLSCSYVVHLNYHCHVLELRSLDLVRCNNSCLENVMKGLSTIKTPSWA